MDALGVVLKILAAIAVIVGAVFVVLKYGDKILAFFNKLLGRDDVCIDSDFVDDSELEDEEIAANEQDFEG
jgi:hypothetical protein